MPGSKPQAEEMEANAICTEKSRKWKLFGLGLGVRLFGAVLIWLGDGSNSLFRKALVVIGVILFVTGIGILKYLLYGGGKKK